MTINYYLILFLVMFITGLLLNPMNVLVYNIDDLKLSLTLIYGALFMASTMLISHEIIHYIIHKKINTNIFIFGILLSTFISIFLLRNQFLVNDKEWLKRMISHHSTALTTSTKIYNRTTDKKIKELAGNIIRTQENEITLMKSLL